MASVKTELDEDCPGLIACDVKVLEVETEFDDLFEEETHDVKEVLQNRKSPVETPIAKFACGACDKIFDSRQKLAEHAHVHAKSGPLGCDRCTIKFRSNTRLLRHTGCRMDESVYVCDHCEKAFRSKSLLILHIHSQDHAQRHQCAVCGASFNTRVGLSRHAGYHERHKQK